MLWNKSLHCLKVRLLSGHVMVTKGNHPLSGVSSYACVQAHPCTEKGATVDLDCAKLASMICLELHLQPAGKVVHGLFGRCCHCHYSLELRMLTFVPAAAIESLSFLRIRGLSEFADFTHHIIARIIERMCYNEDVSSAAVNACDSDAVGSSDSDSSTSECKSHSRLPSVSLKPCFEGPSDQEFFFFKLLCPPNCSSVIGRVPGIHKEQVLNTQPVKQ